MLKFRTLTNVRPTADLGSQIILAPTEGQFKVTPDAAKIIGVADGEYMLLVVDDASGTCYAAKGSYSDEEGAIGSKLASSNKGGGGTLTCSAAAAWQELKGDTNFNTHFAIDAEKVEVLGEGEDAVSYFELTFVEKVEKQVRKKKNADGTDSDEDEEEEVVAEVVTEAGSFEEM